MQQNLFVATFINKMSFHRARWLRDNARDSHSGGSRVRIPVPTNLTGVFSWFSSVIKANAVLNFHYHDPFHHYSSNLYIIKLKSVNLKMKHWLHNDRNTHPSGRAYTPKCWVGFSLPRSIWPLFIKFIYHRIKIGELNKWNIDNTTIDIHSLLIRTQRP